MELQEFNLSLALKSYTIIVELGSKTDDGHIYNGILAQSDFDGYTITLSNADVELSIYFHSKHQLNYKNKLALNEFLEKIEHLSKQKT